MKIALLGSGKTGRVFKRLAQKNHKIVSFDPISGDIKKPLNKLSKEDLKGFDVLVSLLPARLNKEALSLATKLDLSYMDFSSNDIRNPEQLAFKDHFEDKLALINVGIAPGLDNILVAKLKLKGASYVKLYFLEHSFTPFAPSWSIEDMVASLKDKPLIYDKGFIEKENFSDPELKNFSLGCF